MGGDPRLPSGVRTIQCIVHPLRALSLRIYSALNPGIFVFFQEDKRTHNLVVVNSGYYLAIGGGWRKIPWDCEGSYPEDAFQISMLKGPVATDQ